MKKYVGSKVNERRCKDKGRSEKHEKQTEEKKKEKEKGEKVRDVERERACMCAPVAP